MSKAAAKEGDAISVTEIHTTQLGNSASNGSFDFTAKINGGVSTNVYIMGRPAAMNGSTASEETKHEDTPPTPPGTQGTITPPASNDGRIIGGSASVYISGSAAARDGDLASGCSNANPPLPVGEVKVDDAQNATVFIGD